MSQPSPPSSFFEAERSRLLEASRLGPVVDLACGRGRHALAAAEAGLRTVAVDRDAATLAALQARARERRLPLACIRADLETPFGLPLRPGRCGAVLVFRFLYRPLAAAIAEALAPGGLLLYETFTLHQRDFGYGPRNPAFLLEDGELRELFPGLEVLDYFEGVAAGARPAAVARVAARRSASSAHSACSASSGSSPAA